MVLSVAEPLREMGDESSPNFPPRSAFQDPLRELLRRGSVVIFSA